jgi:hypothetical protein
MKTLNDKRLWIAVKEKEKKNRIKEHRDELNNNEHREMQRAWNKYIEHFWPNWSRNWKYDKVLVDANGYVNRIRCDIELEKDYILNDNATMWLYGCTREKLQQRFFEITEELFNS